MQRVAIFGPGLLGGSIALALRQRGGSRVAIWGRRAEAVEEVRASGTADFASINAADVAHGADLVVLCTPIGAMPALAQEIAPVLTKSTLITDVGSVKAPVVAKLSAICKDRARFVGSHPMAGSEQNGLAAARADLFAGSVCIVTPDGGSDTSATADISAFWRQLGCSVRQLAPDEHDEIVALVSHLPHLLAATLVQLVGAERPEAFDFTGPGFRDTTRVASGPPAMWTEIFQTNAGAVRKSAEAMIEKLREIIKLLDRDSLERNHCMNEFLTQAKAHRDRLRRPQ